MGESVVRSSGVVMLFRWEPNAARYERNGALAKHKERSSEYEQSNSRYYLDKHVSQGSQQGACDAARKFGEQVG